jgi:preprotein translocase subunit SecY
MFESLTNSIFEKFSIKKTPTKKILITFFILFLFRFGNTIPLIGIDQEALKKSFLQLNNQNSIIQRILTNLMQLNLNLDDFV